MQVKITYDDASSRIVTVKDDLILELAQREADRLDMVAREAAKKKATSVSASVV